jgi:Na+/H+-translocating membrane pyrophosphatase
MMATTAMQLAIDAFGPISDNAGGIARWANYQKYVHVLISWFCRGIRLQQLGFAIQQA